MDFQKIITQNESQRDQLWEKKFLNAVVHQNFKLVNDQPQTGPDNWPYLLVRTGESATEPCLKLLEWLSERGIGLAVNTHKQLPDYIFTYGMIWGFREYGEFITEPSQPTSEVILKENQELKVGPPSDQYLPPYVRSVIKQFFNDQGFSDVKILVIHSPEQTDLCFSLDSLGLPPVSEHAGIAEALSWFLPQNYSIVLTEEKNFSEFFSL